MYRYRYPHPAVATDICVFAATDAGLQVLLIQRAKEPFRGMWALPGGFLEENEDLDACARRELHEETGLSAAALHQFGIFSDPARDPRERVISVAYLTLIEPPRAAPAAGSDAVAAHWFSLGDLPPLAFDHAIIIARARQALEKLSREDPSSLAPAPANDVLPPPASPAST